MRHDVVIEGGEFYFTRIKPEEEKTSIIQSLKEILGEDGGNINLPAKLTEFKNVLERYLKILSNQNKVFVNRELYPFHAGKFSPQRHTTEVMHRAMRLVTPFLEKKMPSPKTCLSILFAFAFHDVFQNFGDEDKDKKVNEYESAQFAKKQISELGISEYVDEELVTNIILATKPTFEKAEVKIDNNTITGTKVAIPAKELENLEEAGILKFIVLACDAGGTSLLGTPHHEIYESEDIQNEVIIKGVRNVIFKQSLLLWFEGLARKLNKDTKAKLVDKDLNANTKDIKKELAYKDLNNLLGALSGQAIKEEAELRKDFEKFLEGEIVFQVNISRQIQKLIIDLTSSGSENSKIIRELVPIIYKGGIKDAITRANSFDEKFEEFLNQAIKIYAIAFPNGIPIYTKDNELKSYEFAPVRQ